MSGTTTTMTTTNMTTTTKAHDASQSNKIAECALNHYNNKLPKKGKPNPNEWTVCAAIVASSCSSSSANNISNQSNTDNCNCWVVCCATGSKCTAVNNDKKNDDTSTLPYILHDSHAEVLCRRGLVRVLWNEIIAFHHSKKNDATCHSNNNNNNHNEEEKGHHHNLLLEKYDDNTSSSDSSNNTCNCRFQLRKDIQLHLYISDSPCGDASIYEIQKSQQQQQQQQHAEQMSSSITELNFTGAKIILPLSTKNNIADHNPDGFCCVGNDNGGLQQIQLLDNQNKESIIVGRERSEMGQQIKSALRIKSGRAHLSSSQRSTSMSCSDKIAKWCIFGLQGSLLSKYIPTPIILSSICVSSDPRTATNERQVSSSNIYTSNDHDDSQLNALQRAIPDRVVLALDTAEQLLQQQQQQQQQTTDRGGAIIQDLINQRRNQTPRVYIVDKTFQQGKAVVESSASVANTTTTTHTHTLPTIMKQSASASKVTAVVTTCAADTNNNSLTRRTKKRKLNNDDALDENETKEKQQKLQQSSSPLSRKKENKNNNKKGYSPCGFSINWQQQQQQQHDKHIKNNDNVEITVGIRGIKQGKKPKSICDYQYCTSRLSRCSFVQMKRNVVVAALLLKSRGRHNSTISSSNCCCDSNNNNNRNHHNDVDDDEGFTSYKDLKTKSLSKGIIQLKDFIFQGSSASSSSSSVTAEAPKNGPLVGWLVGLESTNFQLSTIPKRKRLNKGNSSTYSLRKKPIAK